VQSEANSAAGGLALKFSPREVAGGGGARSWARTMGIPNNVNAVANIAAQHQDFGRVGRFIFDNDDLHAVVHDDGQCESGV
jgi:hypothetical protein